MSALAAGPIGQAGELARLKVKLAFNAEHSLSAARKWSVGSKVPLVAGSIGRTFDGPAAQPGDTGQELAEDFGKVVFQCRWVVALNVHV